MWKKKELSFVLAEFWKESTDTTTKENEGDWRNRNNLRLKPSLFFTIVFCLSYLFRFRIFSACGELIYSITICFHRRRHSQPRKKLWTFLILRISSLSSLTIKLLLLLLLGVRRHSRFNAHSWKKSKLKASKQNGSRFF